MDMYTACERAYKNGYDNGRQSACAPNIEIVTRITVAYEQLSSCHSSICRASNRGENDDLIYSLQDAMNALLDIQVKLGALKHEEDL
jgi:hypothetical protein